MTEAAEAISADPESAKPAKKRIDWKGEAKGIFWLLLAVLGFHSFIAKPFYIPSESMLPGLLVGDRLVVSKYPYGWSFVSPSFHILPFMPGRVLGKMPERGDVVIASPPGVGEDYIKRVIGLPGDRFEVRGGVVIINGVPVKRGPTRYVDIADYGGVSMGGIEETCAVSAYGTAARRADGEGEQHCILPVVTETLPNGRSYDTIDLGYYAEADDYPATTIPAGHVFLMGDNRDKSADSRFPVERSGLGGAVPWENIGGRAEFITFSLDGSTKLWNPISWFTALRSGRAGTGLQPNEAE